MDEITKNLIRSHDKMAAFHAISRGNLENVNIVLDYIIKNYVDWSKVLDLGDTLTELSEIFTENEQVQKLEKFINGNTIPEKAKTKLQKAVKEAEKLIAWEKERTPEIFTFIRKYRGNNAVSIYTSLIVFIVSIVLPRIF